MHELDVAAEGTVSRGDEARTRDWLVFECGGQRLAVQASAVVEVIEVGNVTCLPRLPPHVPGVTVHRGGAVPLLDVARFLQAGEGDDIVSGAWSAERCLVVHSGEMTVALLVQRVAGLRKIHDDDLEEPQALGAAVRKLADHQIQDSSSLIALLDLTKLLERAKPRAGG